MPVLKFSKSEANLLSGTINNRKAGKNQRAENLVEENSPYSKCDRDAQAIIKELNSTNLR